MMEEDLSLLEEGSGKRERTGKRDRVGKRRRVGWARCGCVLDLL